MKLKDELASVMASSFDRGSSTKKASNLGTILNYKRAEGINDHQSSFRKWTGIPMTTRANKIPDLALNQAKLVAEHRKKTAMSFEKQNGSFDSALGSTTEEPTPMRNISQSAWNKIRQVQLKKRERLTEFNP